MHAESIAPKAEAEDKPNQTVVISLDDLIQREAAKNHLDYRRFYKTLECESENFRDVALQSEVPDATGPNSRENSWGIAQIDLDFHPEVTKEQAQDPTFAIPWAGKAFAERPGQFHCYTKLFAKG